MVAIDQIETAIAASGEHLASQVTKMLRNLNWRPQLVAAATILTGRLAGELPELWAALDRPCWTSPQLAAVASRVDSRFLQHALTRIELGGRMEANEAADMSPIARLSALGPASLEGHSSKLISSLVALCATEEAAKAWLPELLSRQYLQQVIESDTDKAGSIAIHWRARMDHLLGISAN
nr:hypothetical protein [uncultured Devosia sp.]